MLAYLFAAFAVIHIFLLWKSCQNENRASMRMWFLRIMLCSLAYDNMALVLGNMAQGQDWFDPLTRLRFVFHVTILPFLTLFSLSVMTQVGVPLAENRYFKGFAWGFTLVALVYGIYHEVFNLNVGPQQDYGLWRMTNLSGVPPIATILTNVLTIFMGALVWKAKGPRILCLGALTIFIVNGSAASLPWGFMVGNFAEVIFIVSLLRCETELTKHYT